MALGLAALAKRPEAPPALEILEILEILEDLKDRLSGTKLSDGEALDSIRLLLTGAAWSPDVLDAVSNMVKRTGRQL